MGKKILSIVVVFSMAISGTSRLMAQTRVTGHVFAEIVEPAGLAVNTNNEHDYSEKDTILAGLNLGEINITGNPDAVIAFEIYSHGLVDDNGKRYSFDVFSVTDNKNTPRDTKEEQVVKFSGIPDKTILENKNSLLKGHYHAVFIYN